MTTPRNRFFLVAVLLLAGAACASFSDVPASVSEQAAHWYASASRQARIALASAGGLDRRQPHRCLVGTCVAH